MLIHNRLLCNWIQCNTGLIPAPGSVLTMTTMFVLRSVNFNSSLIVLFPFKNREKSGVYLTFWILYSYFALFQLIWHIQVQFKFQIQTFIASIYVLYWICCVFFLSTCCWFFFYRAIVHPVYAYLIYFLFLKQASCNWNSALCKPWKQRQTAFHLTE